VAVVEAGVALDNLTIRNTNGVGVAVDLGSGTFDLRNARVEQCAASGVVLSNRTEASLDDVVLTENEFGLLLRNAASANLERCTLSANQDDGLNASGTTTVVSSNSSYVDNVHDGLDLDGQATLDSTGDTFTGNRENGLELSVNGSPTRAFLDGATITGNGRAGTVGQTNGILARCRAPAPGVPCLRVSNSLILGNPGSGVLFEHSDPATPPALDLGSRTPESPGGNTLQSNAQLNLLAGLCLNSANATAVPAENNVWRECPNVSIDNNGCSAGVDVGGTGTVTANCAQ
jgi:hypothetical protein